MMMESKTEKLHIRRHEHSLVITINNPPANTWDPESLGELHRLLVHAEGDSDIRTLIMTGAGERFFSAGADLKLFATGDKGVAHEMACAFGTAFETLANFRALTIAAINGYAMGGGLECALACDLRVAESRAVMSLPEATVGLLPCGGGTQNLARVVGESWAKRMILCGTRLDADKALAIGLVDEIADPGAALEVALQIATQAERQSPGAASACKKLIRSAGGMPMDAAYAAEREAFVNLFGSRDQLEGVRAFLEKRPPQWKNA